MYQSSTNWTDPFRHLLPLQAAVCCTRSGAAYNLFFAWLLLATNAVANALPLPVVVSLLFLHLLHIIIRNTICTAASECRCESAYNRYTHRIWEHIPHTHSVFYNNTKTHSVFVGGNVCRRRYDCCCLVYCYYYHYLSISCNNHIAVLRFESQIPS